MPENGTAATAGSLSVQAIEIPQLPNQVNHASAAAQHLSSEKTARARPLYAQHSNTRTGASSALATECDLRDCAAPAPSEERIVSPIVAPLPVDGDAPAPHIPEAPKFSRPTALRRFSLISQSLTSLIATKVLEGNSFEDNVVAAVAPPSLWHRVRNSINHAIQPCIISSDGKFRLIFDFIHFIVILGTLLFTPFQVLFNPDVLPSTSSYHTLHFAVDIIFALSIVVNCVTSRRHRGIEVREPVALFIIYSKTRLVLDVILLIPYDLITGAHLVALYRLLRVIYVFVHFTTWLRFTAIHHIVLRLLRLMILLAVLVHWLSCAFSFVVSNSQADSHWLPEISMEELVANDRYRYLVGCYWGFNGVLGHLSTYPHTNSQISLTFCMNVVGLIAHALVFSSVASMVHHIIADTSAFTELISSVNAEMQTLKLPLEMQSRIRSYFVYHNERFNLKKESGLMSRLPPYLQMELSIHLNSEIITNVPFFAHADQSFALQLSKVMTLQVCLPGEFIIRQGDIGTEMYFLTSGSVEVSTGGTVHKVLSSGQFFGEMALIEKSRRTANVKAVTYCDFLVLCKRDLDAVLEDCPEIKRSMVTIVHNRKVSNSFQSKHQSYSLGNLVAEQMAIKKAKDQMMAVEAANAASLCSDQQSNQLDSGQTLSASMPSNPTAQQIVQPPVPVQEPQQLAPAVNESHRCSAEHVPKLGRMLLRPLPPNK
jgi:CRP-like cAMP-binding protein